LVVLREARWHDVISCIANAAATSDSLRVHCAAAAAAAAAGGTAATADGRHGSSERGASLVFCDESKILVLLRKDRSAADCR
jgi:hypothetical protein